MKFRNPKAKKLNAVHLLPLPLLVLALLFAVHSTYQYLTGVEETMLWMGVGWVAVFYFAARSWFAARKVFVWGDEASQ